jgi:hypothetical protein
MIFNKHLKSLGMKEENFKLWGATSIGDFDFSLLLSISATKSSIPSYSSPAMSTFYRWRFFLSFYLVFLTDRFIKKVVVAGYNADDNCREEFKDAAALKNKIFIAVGMEEGVKDQRAWPSIIGLHLGSRLYIDASGDLTNPDHVVSEIRKAAALLDVWAIPATTSEATHPAPVFNGSASTRQLESLTVTEVETLFDALNLGAYKSIVAANALDGVTLSYCATIEDVVSVGITVRPKAAVLLAKVAEFKAAGVPLTLLIPTAPTTSGPPHPEALIQATVHGNVEAIRACLKNRTDIESKDEVCTLFPLSTYILVSSSFYSNSMGDS